MPHHQIGRTKVLIIEDDADYMRGIRDRLSAETSCFFDVACAGSLQEALEHLAKSGADLILLDLILPDSKGLDTFLRINSQAPEIPIVIMTVLGDESLAIEAVGKGAQDYLPKASVDGKMLSRVIRYAIERHRMQSALRSLSLVDDLTGLYNRRGFLRLAEQHIKLARRTSRGSLLVFADLDGLKRINDTFGHAQGDAALIEVAQVLRDTFRTSDVLARYGGDEFAILAIEAREDSIDTIVSRIQENLQAYNNQKRHSYTISLSIGTAYLDPKETVSLEELMSKADKALYEQKRLS